MLRESNFSCSYGGAITNLDQNIFSKDDSFGGLIVQYDYIASDDGKFSLAISPAVLSPLGTPCFHVSAFANIETGIPEGGIVFSILFSLFSIYLFRKN